MRIINTVTNGMLVTAKITTGAKKEKCISMGNNTFEIHVKKKAEHNMANERVRELLAEHFSTIVSKIRIIKGHHMSKKHIEIHL